MPYRAWYTEGESGCKDYYMSFASKKSGFISTKTIKLCYISAYGKLNEGLGKNGKMYIWDLVELISFLYTNTYGISNSPKILKKITDVKYIMPRLSEELSKFRKNVTKII